ncbi:hypothetical protein MKX01_003250, partial [Papaver californicum]
FYRSKCSGYEHSNSNWRACLFYNTTSRDNCSNVISCVAGLPRFYPRNCSMHLVP